ncbi:atherin-like [Cervus elaphus]|uniref:atherin-like n=1 Tax=Cervus elaphus TaxID=9860 RepID=UPI001CC28018|nr:atherin-like [Cervus elaphus]
MFVPRDSGRGRRRRNVTHDWGGAPPPQPWRRASRDRYFRSGRRRWRKWERSRSLGHKARGGGGGGVGDLDRPGSPQEPQLGPPRAPVTPPFPPRRSPRDAPGPEPSEAAAAGREVAGCDRDRPRPGPAPRTPSSRAGRPERPGLRARAVASRPAAGAPPTPPRCQAEPCARRPVRRTAGRPRVPDAGSPRRAGHIAKSKIEEVKSLVQGRGAEIGVRVPEAWDLSLATRREVDRCVRGHSAGECGARNSLLPLLESRPCGSQCRQPQPSGIQAGEEPEVAFVRPRPESLVCLDWKDTRVCRVHALPARSRVSPEAPRGPRSADGGRRTPPLLVPSRLCPACPVSPEEGQGSGSLEGVGSFLRTLVLWRRWQPPALSGSAPRGAHRGPQVQPRHRSRVGTAALLTLLFP